MRISLLRISLWTALLALSATGLRAQHSNEVETHSVACGMQTIDSSAFARAVENTARLRPELYDRMVARVSEKVSSSSMMDESLGFEQSFFVFNNKTGVIDDVAAVLVYDGILARVWIDVRDTARVKPTSSQVRALVRALDTATGPSSRNPNKGILANDIEIFGAPPTEFELEGKTDFLLTDIKEAIQGGYIAGYFSPQDQSQAIGSNLRNILYIDSREGLSSTTGILNTIAHEYQHLIHYARRRNGELFYNEGCSEVASILAGYWNRSNSGYMANTNVDLLSWPSGTTDGSLLLSTYERAMTFIHFLHEQYGERFLYEFVGSTSRGLARVDDALRRIGVAGGVDAETTLRYFAVANYLQTSTDPQYGYRFKVGSKKPTLASSFADETLPESGTVAIRKYGTSYAQIASLGERTLRFSGSGDFRVMAMIYRTSGLEVREMAPEQQYVVGGDNVDKVVLAFVNLDNSAYSITWSATTGSTSAAEAETAADRTTAINAISPNPVDDRATLRFTVAGSEPVSLSIVDSRGREVRTLVDGETLAAGRHEIPFDAADLPAGYYMAHLRQGARASTHVVVVAR